MWEWLEGSWRERKEGAVGKMVVGFSSSSSFALIWIPSEMSAEVGQWDLESLCCFSSPFIPSCQWKMSNAIRRGGDDELQREKARERKERDWVAGSRLTWVLHQPTGDPDKGSEKEGKRDRYLCAGGVDGRWRRSTDLMTPLLLGKCIWG